VSDAPTTTESNPYLRDPDVQLMLRAKAGDDAAFSELVANYQSRLVSILSNLVYSQETAEDLAQDVFMRIYRSKNGYQPTAKFSTWMFRIANNLASNARRSAGRRKEVQMAGGDSSGVQTGNAGEYLVKEKSALMPARQLDKSEMQGIVLSAMEGLNERQKMAVLLHKFEDMSYADIAETMELTVPAVKSLLTRARENLRTQLESYFK
jgi:RNA polymerase sigma-70 factor (ECF subfamily)